MTGKSRTVFFFSAVEVDTADNSREVAIDFWPEVFNHVRSVDDKAREITIRSRLHIGEVITSESPAQEYLYLGKLRQGADWPDYRDTAGNHANLTDVPDIQRLIEPAFIVPVSGTPYIAVLRTSGGPTPTSIAGWLSGVLGYFETGNRLELQAYALKNQLERLRGAVGASRIHLKVAADSLDDVEPGTRIVQAMRAAQDIGNSGVSIDMLVSFGNAKPDEVGADEMAKAVDELLSIDKTFTSRRVLQKATATLMLPSEGHGYVKDKVDFTLDRVTYKEQVGDSDDDPLTPSSVLKAMSAAIVKFRSKLRDQ